MANQPTTIRIPHDLKAWLKKIAKREGRSFSGLLLAILVEYRVQKRAVDKMLSVEK